MANVKRQREAVVADLGDRSAEVDLRCNHSGEGLSRADHLICTRYYDSVYVGLVRSINIGGCRDALSNILIPYYYYITTTTTTTPTHGTNRQCSSTKNIPVTSHHKMYHLLTTRPPRRARAWQPPMSSPTLPSKTSHVSKVNPIFPLPRFTEPRF
jgi:hypothetical protein